MGCSGSKSTNTNAQEPKNSAENERGQKDEDQNKADDSVWVTVEEAITYVQQEMGVSEERAKRIVALCNKNDDGKVSNEELVALWNKVQEARNQLYPKFQEYDKDKTGFVTMEEATSVLKGKMPDVTEDSLKKMLARYDEEGDGKFNFNEFVYFYGNIYARKDHLEAKFKELDKDGSGDIEANTVVTTLCEDCVLEEKMAKSLVEDFDVDKDGKINKEEFFSIFKKIC